MLSSANEVLFRYAEVLLSYAEALNEISGPDQNVYDAINEVRARVNLPPLSNGLDQDKMRVAIRRERRVELSFENKRLFDLYRWKVAEDKLNGTIHAMKITEENSTLKYEIIPAPAGSRTFYADKNYLLPIPQSSRDKNTLLTQNPNY